MDNFEKDRSKIRKKCWQKNTSLHAFFYNESIVRNILTFKDIKDNNNYFQI